MAHHITEVPWPGLADNLCLGSQLLTQLVKQVSTVGYMRDPPLQFGVKGAHANREIIMSADAASAVVVVDDAAKKQVILDNIRGVPDFPIPGILFWDVTTILLNPDAFRYTIELFTERYKNMKVDVVAGFEARGLIFGAPLALALNVPFVPLRKPGKLPGAKLSEEYGTEYSTDKIEIHVGAVTEGQHVLLVDDLIATGGTLKAGARLIERCGGVVMEACCVIELPFLHGRTAIGGIPLFVLVEKEGA